jgi:hypothetical protein
MVFVMTTECAFYASFITLIDKKPLPLSFHAFFWVDVNSAWSVSHSSLVMRSLPTAFPTAVYSYDLCPLPFPQQSSYRICPLRFPK